MRIRAKLALLIAVPIVALGVAAAFGFSYQNGAVETAQDAVATHDNTVAIHMSMIRIGNERLAALGADMGADDEVLTATDSALADLAERNVGGDLEPAIAEVRALVDRARLGQETDVDLLLEANDKLRLIDTDTELRYPDARSRNAITINRLAVHALEAQEVAWIAYVQNDEATSITVSELSRRFAKADELFDVTDRLAIEAGAPDVTTLLRSDANRRATELKTQALDDLAEGAISISDEEVVANTADFRAAFIATIMTLDGRLTEQLDVAVDDASERRAFFVVLPLLGLVVLAGTVYVIYRSVMRPFDHLIGRAGEIANHDLPHLIEVLRTDDGSTDVPQATPIEAEADDEVGELVEAFNNVQLTAYDLATQQAMGRRNVSEMFINLGRRNQQLIQRILKQLTNLESTEEDPERLAELFALDNVATRMRRNAESLLALAGGQTSRRWSKPIDIENAVRAAFGEVEDYERIDVDRLDAAKVSGSMVADITHLVAELLDNALSFSDRDTRVVVDGQLDGESYRITVSDRGIGMQDDDLAAQNRQLSDPPPIDQVPTMFLGLYVVGRLADRHGIEVSLAKGPVRGLVATAILPAELLIDEVAPAASPSTVGSLPTRPVKKVEAETSPAAPGGDDERSPLDVKHDLDAELASITDAEGEGEGTVAVEPTPSEPPTAQTDLGALPVRNRGASLETRARTKPEDKPEDRPRDEVDDAPAESEPDPTEPPDEETTDGAAESSGATSASSADAFSSMMSSLSVGISRGEADSENDRSEDEVN